MLPSVDISLALHIPRISIIFASPTPCYIWQLWCYSGETFPGLQLPYDNTVGQVWWILAPPQLPTSVSYDRMRSHSLPNAVRLFPSAFHTHISQPLYYNAVCVSNRLHSGMAMMGVTTVHRDDGDEEQEDGEMMMMMMMMGKVAVDVCLYTGLITY